MVDPEALVPGQTVTGTVQLMNRSAAPALLALRLSDIRGSLAPELRYSVALDGAAAPPWAGDLAALEDGVVLASDLPGHSTVTCRVSISFPADAGNEWEGRFAAFQEVFSLVQGAALGAGSGPVVPPARSSVVVPSTASVGRTAPLGRALAFTGQQLYSLLAAAAGAVAIGALLTVVSRPRRPVSGARRPS